MSPAALEARRKGGRASSNLPAPEDCEHCRVMGYETRAQHMGHLGFAAVMYGNPTALSNVRQKIERTGRPESAKRWKAVNGSKPRWWDG